jgi:hypothetical protein
MREAITAYEQCALASNPDNSPAPVGGEVLAALYSADTTVAMVIPEPFGSAWFLTHF